MKDLALSRTIPLVGLGAFVFVGCGGRSLEGPGDDGNDGPTGAERLTDENFDDSLVESLEKLCEKNERCGTYNYGYSDDCAEDAADNFHDDFDLDSRACRRLALAAIDCLAEQRSCNDSATYACEDEIYDFVERCNESTYNYDY